MNQRIRVSVLMQQPAKASQQTVAGYLLQCLATSLYQSGDVPLRCFLFPYIDLLQLDLPENAVYFGNFMQFSVPSWSSAAAAQHEASVWQDLPVWPKREEDKFGSKSVSFYWETVPSQPFWPPEPHLPPLYDAEPGQNIFTLELHPPGMPALRDLAYRTFAGKFLSVCQIFHRLLRSCGGKAFCFSPFRICYSAPAECAEKLDSYLLPELQNLGFSTISLPKKE